MDPLTIGAIASGVGSLISMFGSKKAPGSDVIPEYLKRYTTATDAMASDVGRAEDQSNAMYDQQYRNTLGMLQAQSAQNASKAMSALGTGGDNVVSSALMNKYFNTANANAMANLGGQVAGAKGQNAWTNVQQQNALKMQPFQSEGQLLGAKIQMAQANAKPTTMQVLGGVLQNVGQGAMGAANLNPMTNSTINFSTMPSSAGVGIPGVFDTNNYMNQLFNSMPKVG